MIIQCVKTFVFITSLFIGIGQFHAQKNFHSKTYFYLTEEDRNELTLLHDSLNLTADQSMQIVSLFFQFRTQIDQETVVLHEIENLKNLDQATQGRKLISRSEYIRSLHVERDKGVYYALNELQQKRYNLLVKQIKPNIRNFGMQNF